MKKIIYFLLFILGIFTSKQSKSFGLVESAFNSTSKDSNNIRYDFNIVIQYGGESKITAFFPKINILRKHIRKSFKPYYGIEGGLHPLLVTAAYNGSAILGFEIGIFNLESSFSYCRNLGMRPPQGGDNIPYAQSLFNIKGGIGYKGVRIKLGRSLVFWENINQKQKPLPFFDLGKINGRIYGIELQFSLNKIIKE